MRADSDVDVVAMMTSTFRRYLGALSDLEKERYREHYEPGTTTYQQWRETVLTTLRSHYGYGSVHDGRKAIRVDGVPGRLDADVLPAMEYRLFTSFDTSPGEWASGIVFEVQVDGRTIRNWPKQHIENGWAKNSVDRTRSRYKPYVRMFKNARNRAAELGHLERDRVPSYFLECFLFNAPDVDFRPSFGDGYLAIISSLAAADLDSMKCQNDIVDLFGGTPEQWDHEDAVHALGGLVSLWQNW